MCQKLQAEQFRKREWPKKCNKFWFFWQAKENKNIIKTNILTVAKIIPRSYLVEVNHDPGSPCSLAGTDSLMKEMGLTFKRDRNGLRKGPSTYKHECAPTPSYGKGWPSKSAVTYSNGFQSQEPNANPSICLRALWSLGRLSLEVFS